MLSRTAIAVAAITATLFTGSTSARAASPPREQSTARALDDSVIVSPAWLAAHMSDPSVVVLFTSTPREEAGFAEHHIPGAHAISMALFLPLLPAVNSGDTPPSLDDLRSALEHAGVSNRSTVVLYGNAPQSFVMLQYLGLRPKVLDGGLIRWMAEGRPVTSETAAVKPGTFVPALRRDFIVNAEWVESRLNKKGVVLLDTRTPGEYTGGEGPAFTKGHIPGAQRITVEDLVPPITPQNEFQLRPIEQVRALFAERAQPHDTIVTYCTVGARATKSYLVALHLGYAARIYIGSYQDWAQRGLPLVAGSKP